MASPAAKLKFQEAQAQRGLGLLISGLWWQPSRVAVYRGGQWRTYQNYYTPTVATAKAVKSVAVSPIGTDGLAWFAAWDVDSGNPQDVRKLLAALPEGATPLVSVSGKKGWHVWCFFDRPLPVQTAVSFAKAVLLKSGVRCEIRPTGPNSLCLKWPGQRHPETGEVEEFINLETGEAFDTAALLGALAGGMYRTPAEVVEDYTKQHGKAAAKKQDSPDAGTTWFAYGNHVDATWTPTECLQGGTLDELAKREELVHEVMRLAGRKPVPLGKAFRCILHPEKHPSATWVRLESGHIMYHDWHQRDDVEWFTVQEVFHAIATGQVKKLGKVEAARWLAMLGLRSGFATELVLRQREKCKAAAAVLVSLQQESQHELTQQDSPTPSCDSPYPTWGLYLNGWLQSQQANGLMVGSMGEESYSTGVTKEAGDWAFINRIWEAVCEEVQIQAFAGFEEVALSKRFLARRAGVRPELANRAVNLLCVLGLLGKVPNSGGMKGDRFILGNVGLEEARRRFEALFQDGSPDLRRFSKVLVAAKLGEDVAAAVFRRGAEEPAANPCQTHGQGMAIPSERYSKGIAEVSEYLSEAPPLPLPKSAQGNPFVEAIGQAELEGNQERVYALLHGLAAWLTAGRPPDVAAYLGHT